MRGEPDTGGGDEQESWFDDPADLLGILRETGMPWERRPDLPDFADFVEVGRGGQAVVYRARHGSSGRVVAIKILRGEAGGGELERLRFEREIGVVRALDHPNIVRIESHGVTADGRHYFVMDFVDGLPIDDAVPVGADGGRDGRDVHAVIAVFRPVCAAVQHAHLRGIMHRDLKPANILVDASGAPRVLDFGLARPQADHETTSLARVSLTGQFVGSLAWASPEQLTAEPDDLDVRSDVFALGVILYELLTGRLPHPVDGPLEEVLARIVRMAAPPPRSIRPELPDDLAAIVMRCLEKDPEHRYQTAGEIARDLERFLAGEPIEARRRVAWHAMQSALHRSRRLLIGAAVAGVLLLGFGATMGVLYRQATTARAAAAARQREAEAVTAYFERTLVSVDPLQAPATPVTVRQMLAQAAERLADEDDLEPSARARIGLRLARACFHLGLHEYVAPLASDALAHARGSADTRRRSEAREIAAAGTALLGLDHHHHGRLDQAIAMFEEAIAIRRTLHGPDHPETLTPRIHLAVARSARGEYATADRMLRAVLDAARGQDPHVAWMVEAQCLFRLAQLDAVLVRATAEERFRSALALYEQRSGAANVHAAECQSALAELLCQVGPAPEAMERADAAIAIYTRLIGPDHPQIADCLKAKAWALAQSGDIDAAIPLFEEAIALLGRVVGPDHRRVAHVRERYGSALYVAGRWAAATTQLRAALASYEDLLGADHPDAAVTRGNLGCALLAAGRAGEAEPLLRRAHADLRAHFGEDPAQGRHIAGCLDRLDAAR